MIPTTPLSSGMPTEKKYMGWWGDMGGPKQKGIATYTISPYRLSPMRGVVSHWVINGTKRVSTQAVFFVAPLALAYGLIEWAKEDNALRNSKKGHLLGKFV